MRSPIEIVDHATGVAGTYCIGRKTDHYWQFWNPSGWAGSGYVFEDLKLVDAIAALLRKVE